MKLQVLRFSSESDSTNGLLLDVTDGVNFLAYTLEDEYRKDKISKETRIPAGTYEIKLRNEGGFNKRYSKKYSSIHRGMLHIIDVPNFEYILIHVGNSDEHTAGCLLVGDTQENNQINKNGFIGSSGNAYKRIYPLIADAVENEGVTIQYIDLN
jgi:hypothetical protein